MAHRVQKKLPPAAGLVALLLLAVASPAWAMQGHSSAEGLVVHQLGHLLFAGAMLFLLIRSHLDRWTGPGWARFNCFLRLITFWNILTFSGHWLGSAIADDRFVMAGERVVGMKIGSLAEAFFYCTSLDHLVLVPALVCLVLALQQWTTSGEGV